MEIVPLGKLIADDSTSDRDAFHIAIAPVVAAEKLKAGDRIGFVDDSSITVSRFAEKIIGIVDPYLESPVKESQRFYMCLLPNTTTGMKHLWQHPSFDARDKTAPQSSSEAWLRSYAIQIGARFDELIDHADIWATSKDSWGEYWVDGGRWEGMSTDENFWNHYEKYKGVVVPEDKKQNFFSCSC